jgi:hypothetical protein
MRSYGSEANCERSEQEGPGRLQSRRVPSGRRGATEAGECWPNLCRTVLVPFILVGAVGCSSSEAGSPSGVESGVMPDGSSTSDSAIESGPSPLSVDGALDGNYLEGSTRTAIDGRATVDAGNNAPDSTIQDARLDVDASLTPPYGPNLVSIFDGTSLAAWTVVVDGKVTNTNPTQWTVVNGALHSTGASRNFIYYTPRKFGDFRFIFTVRLISDIADTPPHVPCVLFWGSSTTDDAMDALQVQPPKGYTWDYRKTSGGINLNASGGAAATKDISGYSQPDTSWAQCEMLANVAAGTMRMACCPSDGDTKCAGAPAAEIVALTVQTPNAVEAPVPYYLALQAHTGNNGGETGQIEEFKDLYVESPVMAPTTFVTTQ